MNDLQTSIILNIDSYKASMYKQYPPNTTGVYSYVESRGGEYDCTLFFGLQAFVKQYLAKPISILDIEMAEHVLSSHGVPFNRPGWEYIYKEHRGYLPLRVRGVPEGTVVPTGNVLATVENTDPNCFWLTTYIETAMLRAIWYPTTVATQSKAIKNIIAKHLNATGDIRLLDFKLHDFGARGVSSMESAGLGGAAHLVNFKGTDTIVGMLCAQKYYGECDAYSIPAAEHSTITAWGRCNEAAAYENMINQYGSGMYSVVSDSYDIYHAVEEIWGDELKDKVIAKGGSLVIRPDSGDPITVCNNVIEILGDKFGYTTNEKGYKVLNNIRVIQGDGVNKAAIEGILKSLAAKGWSADNIAFGMGGALLQGVNRDTLKFAMKCSAVEVDGEWIHVYKDPVTDSGKRSKRGRVTLWESGGEFFSGVNAPNIWVDKGVGPWTHAMETYFEDGEVVFTQTFDQVRANSMI